MESHGDDSEKGIAMLTTTADAIKSMLKADPSLTPDDRNTILAVIRNHGRTGTPKGETGPQLITRRQAASMLSRSPRLIDLLAADGTLQRVTFPGRTRAAGFRLGDVVSLIEGRPA